jgi:putative SOS response-associated peptidase YedK
MCGRYTLYADAGRLRQRFALDPEVEIRERYNVAPSDEVLAVNTSREGERRSQLLRWGLVPHWAKEPGIAVKTINARAETVAEKPAYRDAFERMRCLIIADGFYEWEKLEDGSKQPWWISLRNGEPFAFAGLWASWQPPEDRDARAAEPLRSCAIVTTSASPVIEDIHTRMPVILAPGEEDAWLDRDTPAGDLHAMLRPLPGSELARRPVSRAVNDARYDGPDCLAEPEPREAERAAVDATRAPRLF